MPLLSAVAGAAIRINFRSRDGDHFPASPRSVASLAKLRKVRSNMTNCKEA